MAASSCLWVKNFGEIALCRTVFKIHAYFVFCNFCKKFENSKWPPFLTGKIFFENWGSYSAVTLLVKNFVEIALSSTAFEIQAFLCFAFLKKIQNGCYFWQAKYFLKLRKASLHRYPVGQKFCRNRSILHGFRDTSIFVFCDFCKKFKIATVFGRTKNL